MGFNLALIVEKLLTQPRGWEVEDLKRQLGIADRTYRKYRRLLTEQFQPFQIRDGRTLLREVEVGETRYLRLVNLRECGLADDDFDARVAMAHLSHSWLAGLVGTSLGQAVTDLLEEFQYTVRDRSFVRSSVFRDIATRLKVEPISWPEELPTHLDSLVTAVVRKRRIRLKLQNGRELTGNLERLQIGRNDVAIRIDQNEPVELVDVLELHLLD